MNRLIFEGRCLLGIVGSIMRQDDLRIMHKRLDWEKMYRMAEYHRIVNIVYLGILGHGEDIPEKWRNRFFERYQEYLNLSEVCDEAEREVLALFDMREIPSVVLGSNQIRKLYELEEASGIHCLSILLNNRESYALAKGYLIDLGYELEETVDDAGERFKAPSGLSVDIYWTLPFKPPYYKKQAYSLIERAVPAAGFSFARVLRLEDIPVFMLAYVVYEYVTNALTLQSVLDLYVFHHKWWSESTGNLTERLKAFKIEELAGRILDLSYMWFADKEEPYLKSRILSDESNDLFDSLENRLLTRGMISTEKDIQAIELDKAISKEQEKEKRRDKIQNIKSKIYKKINKFRKKMGWIFPSYSYMCSMYPVLEKIPFLYPFFWGVRGLRKITRMFRKKEEPDQI